MSELAAVPAEPKENPPRASGDIQQEYARLCSQAGHLQYQVAVHQKDLELLNNKLRELNFDYAAAQRREAEESKKSEEQKEENK